LLVNRQPNVAAKCKRHFYCTIHCPSSWGRHNNISLHFLAKLERWHSECFEGTWLPRLQRIPVTRNWGDWFLRIICTYLQATRRQIISPSICRFLKLYYAYFLSVSRTTKGRTDTQVMQISQASSEAPSCPLLFQTHEPR